MVKAIENKKVVGYCRVSTDKQAKNGVSLEAQQEKIKQYVALHDLTLAEIIVDAGESAKSVDRPGMQRLIAMLRAGELSAIVVYKTDRLFRNLLELLTYTQEFEKRGVALCSITEKFDTSTASGRAVYAILGVIAQMEREQTGERTKFGLAQVKANGTYLGSVPLGWDKQEKGGIVPNPKEQRVRRWIIELRQQGNTMRGIAEALNAAGTPTKHGKSRWFASSVKRVIDYEMRY